MPDQSVTPPEMGGGVHSLFAVVALLAISVILGALAYLRLNPPQGPLLGGPGGGNPDPATGIPLLVMAVLFFVGGVWLAWPRKARISSDADPTASPLCRLGNHGRCTLRTCTCQCHRRSRR